MLQAQPYRLPRKLGTPFHLISHLGKVVENEDYPLPAQVLRPNAAYKDSLYANNRPKPIGPSSLARWNRDERRLSGLATVYRGLNVLLLSYQR